MIRRLLSSRLTIFALGAIVGGVLVSVARDETEEVLAGTAENLVVNGGFEEGGDGPAGKGWFFDGKKLEGKGAVSRDGSLRNTGESSLHLKPTEKNRSAGGDPLGVGQLITGPGIKAKKLHVRAWMGASDGATATLGVVALRANGSEIARAALSEAGLNDGGLREQTTSLDIPKPREVARLLLFLVATGGDGNAYFDDIIVSQEPLAVAIASDPFATEAIRPRIKVDARKVVRAIPRTLYGTNIEWIDNGNHIIRPDGSFDEDVVKYARQAGISIIRYPGGVFSDHFHWQEAEVPLARRPTKEHFPNGPKSKLLLGTHEVENLAEKIGAELLITVNAGTGSAEEAAAWVANVNNGSRPKVRFWEIGNELYMKSFSDTGPQEFKTGPDRYAEMVVEFADKMRKADPSIKLMAIGANNFTKFPLTDHPDWTEKVLRKAASKVDFIAVHNAYAPLLVDGKESPQDVYLSLLASPELVRKNLAELSERLDRLPRDDAERIKIAITEWGPFFQVHPTGRYLDHPKTLGSALFVASVLKVFMENPRVEVANSFKLSEPTFMGWMGPRDGRVHPKASLLALELFAKHFGDKLIHSETTSPTYAAPSVGLMPAVAKSPWFESIASLDDKGRLYVVGINKHFTAPAEASLSIEGFTPEDHAEVWTLTGSGIDANTGTELPRVPGLEWAKQVEVDPFRRMNKGNPSEVTLSRRRIEGVSGTFSYTFPPRSVTSLVLSPAKKGSR